MTSMRGLVRPNHAGARFPGPAMRRWFGCAVPYMYSVLCYLLCLEYGILVVCDRSCGWIQACGMIGWRGGWCGWGLEGFSRDLHKDLGICKEVRGVRFIYFRYLKVRLEGEVTQVG